MKNLIRIFLIFLLQNIPVTLAAMPTLPELTPNPAPLPDLSVPLTLPTPPSTPDPLALPLPATTPLLPDPLAPATPIPVAIPALPTPLPAPTLAPSPIATVLPLPTPTPIAPPAKAPTPDTNKKNFDQIITEIDTMGQLKDTLKSQLSEIDNKLIQAQKDIAAAKKLSFELLGKGDDALAQSSIEQIHQSLKNIKNSQLEIETKVSQGFNKTVTDIQNHMTSIQNQIKVLEMSTPAATTPAQPAALLPQPPAAAPSVATSTAKTARPQRVVRHQASIIHRIFDKIADLVSWAVDLVFSMFSGIKEMIFPSTPSMGIEASIKNEEILKKKVSSVPVAPVTAPVTTEPAKPQTGVALSADIKASLVSMDDILKKLHEQKLAVKKMYREVKDKSQTLQQQLSKNPELEKNISQPISIEEKGGVWKRKAQDLFSSFLDTVEKTTDFAQKAVVRSYNSLAKLTSKVAKDVKTKVLQDDEAKYEDKK